MPSNIYPITERFRKHFTNSPETTSNKASQIHHTTILHPNKPLHSTKGHILLELPFSSIRLRLCPSRLRSTTPAITKTSPSTTQIHICCHQALSDRQVHIHQGVFVLVTFWIWGTAIISINNHIVLQNSSTTSFPINTTTTLPPPNKDRKSLTRTIISSFHVLHDCQ